MAGNFQSWLVYQEKNNGEFGKFFFKTLSEITEATSLSVTDIWDEIWGWQVWMMMNDPTPFVTNIRKTSPIWKFFQLKTILEINPAFGVRTNNVQMFFDNYDDGLDIIGLESTGMEMVSLKSSNYFQLHRYWWRMLETKYVGDGFGHFGNQQPLSFYISLGHQ